MGFERWINVLNGWEWIDKTTSMEKEVNVKGKRKNENKRKRKKDFIKKKERKHCYRMEFKYRCLPHGFNILLSYCYLQNLLNQNIPFHHCRMSLVSFWGNFSVNVRVQLSCSIGIDISYNPIWYGKDYHIENILFLKIIYHIVDLDIEC